MIVGEPVIGDVKDCRVCAEPIRRQANKCTHCGSFQNWRSVLPVSSTILSLLVALVSVTTTAVPILIHAATANRSDVKISTPNYANGFITSFVSNAGDRPAIVAAIGMLFIDKKSNREGILPFYREEEEVGAMVQPAGAVLLHLQFAHPGSDLGQIEPESCRLSFIVTNFDGTTRMTEQPIACPGNELGVRVVGTGNPPRFFPNERK